MGAGILDAVAPIVQKLLSFIPDPQQKAAAQLALIQAEQAGEFKQIDAQLQINLAQAEVNKTEAASASLFRAGWRPAVGWICASAVGVQYVVAPLGSWVVSLWTGRAITFPTLDLSTLMPLLLGMLGLTAARSYEKVNGLP
jgi:hypothetical protein